jgi:hypothetical protein
MKLWQYIKHSDLSIKLFLNPCSWFTNPLDWDCHWGSTYMDPGLVLYATIRFLFVRVHIHIDDGSW